MSEVILTDANFGTEVTKSSEPVLVDFYADWCGPCRMQGPIVEELAHDLADQGVKIGKLDVDKNINVAQKFGVLSIPTLIFFKDGKEVERMSGVHQKEQIKQKLLSLK